MEILNIIRSGFKLIILISNLFIKTPQVFYKRV